jgi:hypothetical protein
MQVSRTSIANAITDGLPMKVCVVVVELKVHPQGPSVGIYSTQVSTTSVAKSRYQSLGGHPCTCLLPTCNTRRNLQIRSLDAEYDMKSKT